MYSNNYLTIHLTYAEQVRKTYWMAKIMLIINIIELGLKNTFRFRLINTQISITLKAHII